MKGDFSRDSFNLKKNFSRVLMQQGRVQLDADWNEQSSILLHYIRALANDLIGPHAGTGGSFFIDFLTDGAGKPIDLSIGKGRYYVDGILCENEGLPDDMLFSYFNQPYYQPEKDNLLEFPYLIYLDVWERHITCLEDESLCEVALGGIDTTTRAQVVWQVKLRKLKPDDVNVNVICSAPLPPATTARLSARTQPSQISDDPCNIEPDARYRGAENQLYRVEIHTGNVDEFDNIIPNAVPTFKWSRENGSVVFAIMNITKGENATEVRLTNLGRDDKFSLREGDWVELVDDAYTLNNRPGKLLKIASIDRDEMSVSLNGKDISISENSANHPLLRRWDQKAGNSQEGGLTLNTGTDEDTGADKDNAAIILEEDDEEKGWLKLEDGIQIKFEKNAEPIYRTGDYWLIPARTATGDVVWGKNENGKPEMQLPKGVEHHYAPLGVVSGNSTNLTRCNCTIRSVLRNCSHTEGDDDGRAPRSLKSAEPKAAKPETAKTKERKPSK